MQSLIRKALVFYLERHFLRQQHVVFPQNRLHRARYFGVGKIHAQLAMAAIGQNLLKAANKITLNTQTRAIA